MICAVALLTAGCATTGGNGQVTDENVEQFALDLRDITTAAATYDLSENPEHRDRIARIEANLRSLGTGEAPTNLDQLLNLIQPYLNGFGPEAALFVAPVKIALRRVNTSYDIGVLTRIQPLFLGVADGLAAALEAVPQ